MLLKSLFKDDEKALFENGNSTGSSVALSAAARILEVRLSITDVDKHCSQMKVFKWGNVGPIAGR